jgi:gluconolactonase
VKIARFASALVLILSALPGLAADPAPQDAPEGKPEAVLDLATAEGAKLVAGQWRYSDARIVETQFPGPGSDNQPTGPLGKTYDVEPHAGPADFDDSKWEAIAPESLSERRGAGRLGFNWYRITVTVPAKIGDYDPAGKTVVFETAVDDAAEVWVDGELARYLGQRGGSMVAGWNAPNRVIAGRNVKPGQKIQIALFGVN